MAEQLISLGIGVIFIGIVLLVVGSILTAIKGNSKPDFAFGGFIGPIPFGFANREDLLKLVIIVSVIIIIAFLLLGRKI